MAGCCWALCVNNGIIQQRLHAECGEWLPKKDFFYGTIDEASSIASDADACLNICMREPRCNAVTYKPFNKQCWVKSNPEGEVPIQDDFSETYKFCPEDESSQKSAGAAPCLL